MGMGKGNNPPPPKVAGLDDLNVVTNETDVPVPYFAGVRLLNVSWIMDAVVTRIVKQDQGGKK